MCQVLGSVEPPMVDCSCSMSLVKVFSLFVKVANLSSKAANVAATFRRTDVGEATILHIQTIRLFFALVLRVGW